MSSHEGAPPYGGYAAIVGTFFTGLGAVAGLAKRAPTASALDLVALSAATFKASRAVSRERVGSFIRQPLVEGPAEDGAYERPAGTGLQRALGELVLCPRCLGTWTAAALGSTQLLAPRFGRLLVWSLGAAAANDFLQAGFVAPCAKASALEERTGP